MLIELQVQYMLKPGENMLCTKIVSDIQNNFCTQHVLPMTHVLQKEELLTKIYLYIITYYVFISILSLDF